MTTDFAGCSPYLPRAYFNYRAVWIPALRLRVADATTGLAGTTAERDRSICLTKGEAFCFVVLTAVQNSVHRTAPSNLTADYSALSEDQDRVEPLLTYGERHHQRTAV